MTGEHLGDVARTVDCEHRTAPRTEELPYAYSIGTQAVRNGRIDLARAKPVSRETYESWTARATPQPGDLIFSREAPMGEVGAVPEGVRLCLGQRTVLVRPMPERIDHRFLKFSIMAPQTQAWIESKALGSTVRHLNVADVRRIPLPNMPGLSEQRRIVEILEDHLSRLDAADDYLDASLRRTERLAAAELWQVTHTGTERTPRRLDQIAEVRLGRQRSPANHYGTRMRPYLRAANVDWNRLRLEDVKEMNFTEAEESTYRLEVGDILLVEASGSAGEVGKSVVYLGTPAEVCFQNTLLRVRCGRDASPRFVQKYLLAEAMAGRFIEGSRGVGINHIGRAKLASLEVIVPPLAEQQRLADACDRALATTEILQAAVREAQERSSSLRRALLSAAFSGRLTGRPSDLDLAEEMALA